MINENHFYSINADDVVGGMVYISQSLDSSMSGTIWHRTRVFASKPGWKIFFYSSDNKRVTTMGGSFDLDDYLQKSTVLKPDDPIVKAQFWSVAYENPVDILMYAFKGRYIWVKIERDSKEIIFEKIRLYYPAHSFTRYMPGIYQPTDINSFFSRFVAVFQSIYLDMDEKIADFPAAMEPESLNDEFLPVLANWFGCEEFFFLPSNKKREYLLMCVELYKSYGTRACIERVIEWLCDKETAVVEYVDFEAFASQERMTGHYGKDMLLFTVLIHDAGILNTVSKLMEKLKPSYTECRIVELNDKVVLDRHTYLGVNSYLI